MKAQLALFTSPVDVGKLSDSERTVLEAIDHLGSLNVPSAGRIVYRLRGYGSNALFVRREWICSAGAAVLARLESRGLISRGPKGTWLRSQLMEQAA